MSRSRWCSDCDGKGTELLEDCDEHGLYRISVKCEGCAGHGELIGCVECDEAMTVPEHEEGRGRCIDCRLIAEDGDQAAEMNRIGRRVA